MRLWAVSLSVSVLTAAGGGVLMYPAAGKDLDVEYKFRAAPRGSYKVALVSSILCPSTFPWGNIFKVIERKGL